MVREIVVDLDSKRIWSHEYEGNVGYGKALAVQRIIKSKNPNRTIYLTGFTPITASGLGFAGKMNLYGISLLGGNLQGSRSGGLVARYLTRLGVAGIEITGECDEPQVLVIDAEAAPHLVPINSYGKSIHGTTGFARYLYAKHGDKVGLAITDPATTGFDYNAVTCNAKHGQSCHRVAGRSTSRFGRNGLVGVVVERSESPLHGLEFDKREAANVIRRIHKDKANANLAGSNDEENPLLGGTYGAAAKARLDNGHGLTNLFRGARVPDEFYEKLLPENMVREQLQRSRASGLTVSRHSCMPGCPNKCSQVVILKDAHGARVVKAGEWETYQGVINLGVFEEAVSFAAWIIEHSNEYAYDHIEALVTLAALALVSESKVDTGVRYGERDSFVRALNEAVEGKTELGLLIRRGAAVVEEHYGVERHFTVGGHALPFHNGRSVIQTGIGLSWTYGRHGESCAGPGRHNFLGEPYDPSNHGYDPEWHIYNTIHGMVMYGAVDEMGICFFMGPSLDTLVDCEAILHAMKWPANVHSMIADSALTIRAVYHFNAKHGVEIQPMPRVFYETPTWGNKQSAEQGVVFDIPFQLIKEYGEKVLDDVAYERVIVPEEMLAKSRGRYT